jgi:hypothetical protein
MIVNCAANFANGMAVIDPDAPFLFELNAERREMRLIIVQESTRNCTVWITQVSFSTYPSRQAGHPLSYGNR